MSFKTYLIIRIALLAALCLTLSAGYLLWSGVRTARESLDHGVDVIARQLQAQQIKIAAGFDRPERFPYLDPLLETGLLNGVCVTYTPPDGGMTQSSCKGWEKLSTVPGWFSAAYRYVFQPGQEVSRELTWRKVSYGRISAAADADARISEAWNDVWPLLGITAGTVLALCMLVYLTTARALRPIREILLGIERLENGELATRLPAFDRVELSRISAGFNRLATGLEQSAREKEALMRKLVSLQEEERRHLARELHDELGQCLAAIKAISHGVTLTAQRSCPELIEDGERLGRASTHMMDLVRGMLQRLRPIDIEQLGFAASIKSLLAQWRGGATHVDLQMEGDFGQLPDALAMGIYRLIQECLTNVSKHSNATEVSVRIRRDAQKASASEASEGDIVVTVEDNGSAQAENLNPTPRHGLLGMRERVTALGGQLLLQARQSSGFLVRARLPMRVPVPVPAG